LSGRAVGRVVAEVAEQRAGVVGQLERDAALGDALDDVLDLETDDLADLLAGQRLELDDVVEAVDELGLEVRLSARAAAGDVRRHDEHDVLEVDGAALAVGQAPSSITWSRTLNTSGWAFSISSSRTTL
jgi:hypothetical protein